MGIRYLLKSNLGKILQCDSYSHEVFTVIIWFVLVQIHSLLELYCAKVKFVIISQLFNTLFCKVKSVYSNGIPNNAHKGISL